MTVGGLETSVSILGKRRKRSNVAVTSSSEIFEKLAVNAVVSTRAVDRFGGSGRAVTSRHAVCAVVLAPGSRAVSVVARRARHLTLDVEKGRSEQ